MPFYTLICTNKVNSTTTYSVWSRQPGPAPCCHTIRVNHATPVMLNLKKGMHTLNDPLWLFSIIGSLASFTCTLHAHYYAKHAKLRMHWQAAQYCHHFKKETYLSKFCHSVPKVIHGRKKVLSSISAATSHDSDTMHLHVLPYSKTFWIAQDL